MSMQGRDNESEAEPDPPDSFNSISIAFGLGLGRIKGVSMSNGEGISKGTPWQKKVGRGRHEYGYENEKNAKEGHALVHIKGHWLVSYGYPYSEGFSQSSPFLFSQLLRPV